MASNLVCPMHPKPYPPCYSDGSCRLCGRSWFVDERGNMMSKRRSVQIVGELKEGADINEVIRPVFRTQP